MVKLGKDSVDAAVNIDDRFVPLQKRLETSMNELTGVEAEVQS